MFTRIHDMTHTRYLSPEHVQYVLDVGAFHGNFSATLRASGDFPHAHYLLLEANSKHEGIYQKLQFPYIISVIGDVDDEDVIYYRANPHQTTYETGNSIFKEETIYFEEAIQETRKSYTIDTLLNVAGLGNIPFQLMKLDIQGAELKALRGAKRLIERSPDLVIITEVSFVPYNGPSAPNIFDIMLEMEKMDFKMIDIVGINYANVLGKGLMSIQCDIAWTRTERIRWNGKTWKSQQNYHVDITRDEMIEKPQS